MRSLRQYDKGFYEGRQHIADEDRMLAYLFKMDLEEYLNLKSKFILHKDIIDIEGDE